jgi:RND family efflux transporter MFP subunit
MHTQTFSHFIEVQAKVEGDQDVLLSAETAGTVTTLNVTAGDRVSAGQILALIDDKIIRQSIGEMQSQLDLSIQLYNRQKNLWDQQIGSEVQFLQAKSNKESMERRMNVLNQQLEMTRIKSPFSGTVDEVKIKVGQTVSPGMPAIRVVNLTSLKVKGEVAESFISNVNKGNQVILYFPDQNKELKTKVDYSGSRIDPVNRTFNVEVRLAEKHGEFHPNMIAIMKIVDYTNDSAYVVPVGSVQKSADGQFVYVAEVDGKKIVAKRKIVETGMMYNGYAEIKSGLDEGDKVITNGFQNVIEGDIVSL